MYLKVCVSVPQIEVMHEESQGGSTHVVVTSETAESLSNRRRYGQESVLCSHADALSSHYTDNTTGLF